MEEETNLMSVCEDGVHYGHKISLVGKMLEAKQALDLLQDNYYCRPPHEPGNCRPGQEIYEYPQPANIYIFFTL